jgi:hypothetical protein
MPEVIHFDHEEVSFVHDNEEFIYNFHQFDSGRITFKRQNKLAQEPEVEVFPAGEKQIRIFVPIVLYKVKSSGVKMNGILPEVLSKLLELYTKEQFETDLKRALLVFPHVNTKIATVGEIMEFVAPYAPWTVIPELKLIVES